MAVRYGAWLYSAPNESAPRARNPVWADRNPPVGYAHVYRLRHAGDEWLEIDTAVRADMDEHCMYRNGSFKKLDVRLFVNRSDAVPVTARRIRYRYNDKTWIELQAGAPVRHIRAHRFHRGYSLYSTSAGQFRLETFLPHNAVSLGYRPTGNWKNVPSDHYVNRKAKLRFGGTGVVRQGRYPPTMWIQAMSPDTKHPRVVLQKECLRMKVIVRDKDIVAAGAGGLGMGLLGSVGGGSAPVATLSPGTTLLWPDGARAGSVFKAYGVTGTVVERDGMRCFEHGVQAFFGKRTNKREAQLPLCVAEADWPAHK